MADDIALKISHVYKDFKLPHERRNSIKERVLNWRHKVDYEKLHALKDIDVEVKRGEFFGIVGRNGSGKSTLLKMIGGIYQPTKGSIQVNGTLTPFIELGIGFNPELTGRENVFLNGAILGLTHKEIEQKYDEIVAFSELEKFMDQKIKNYSSGMQVRLAFSIAIRAHNDILLIDEVLAVGDANFQKKCFDYFRQLKYDRKTVIFVSHDMDSVRKFCDRAMLISKGEVLLIDNPEKVSTAYIKQNMETETAKQDKPEKKRQQVEHGAEINGITLRDGDGKKITKYTSHQPIEVEVEYSTAKDVGEVNVGIGLYSVGWGYVFGYNTQMDEVKVKKGNSKISVYFDGIPLLPGDYYINVVCFGEDEVVPYDFKSQILTFRVYDTGRSRIYRGVLNTKHEWRP